MMEMRPSQTQHIEALKFVKNVAKMYTLITEKTWPRQDVSLIPKSHKSDLDRIQVDDAASDLNALSHWNLRENRLWGRQTKKEWYEQIH